jgi:hypothetical protein
VALATDLVTTSASANPQVFAIKRPLTGASLGDLSMLATKDPAVPFIFATCKKKPSGGADATLEEHDAPSGGTSSYSASA